ncbi:hypothetical protein GF357_01765 [Candidatus Dojkabacteria bacterium]|nr:hypothetical protein [Candidatus Dojkabacteria bacterium]
MKHLPNKKRDYTNIPTTSVQVTNSSTEVESYWKKLLKCLPSELRDEAVEKGFKLSLFAEDQTAQYFILQIPNATRQLKEDFEALMPYLMICGE